MLLEIHLYILVFNENLKHRNKSNSFQFKLEGGLYSEVIYCFQVDWPIIGGVCQRESL